ncbi:MAG: hypothetical protein ACLFQW_11375, partial [Spirochaetaceae bacterium]
RSGGRHKGVLLPRERNRRKQQQREKQQRKRQQGTPYFLSWAGRGGSLHLFLSVNWSSVG